MSCVLKENATECSRMPLKLYGKPLEANAATRFRALPSALRDTMAMVSFPTYTRFKNDLEALGKG